MSTISSELKRARKAKGLTQKQVVANTNGQADQAQVSRAENGERNVNIPAIDAMAAAMGHRWLLVPLDAPHDSELASLPDDVRRFLLRLARLLAAMPPERRELLMRLARLLPLLGKDRIRDLTGDLQVWEEDYPPEGSTSDADASDSSPTTQDSRANVR